MKRASFLFIFLIVFPNFVLADAYCIHTKIDEIKIKGNDAFYKQNGAPWRKLGDLNEYGIQSSYSLLLTAKATGINLQTVYPDGYNCYLEDLTTSILGISTYESYTYRGEITFSPVGEAYYHSPHKSPFYTGSLAAGAHHTYDISAACVGDWDEKENFFNAGFAENGNKFDFQLIYNNVERTVTSYDGFPKSVLRVINKTTSNSNYKFQLGVACYNED